MNQKERIKSITIENFKGISSPVKVDLKPITLLFGKNSAGKSTILQAMLYALEVISTGKVDIDTVQLGGDAIHLGGFRNIVHKHEMNRKIKLRFDLDLGPYGLESFPLFDEKYGVVKDAEGNEIPSAYYIPEEDVFGEAKTAYVLLELGMPADKPLIIKYSVGVDGLRVASIIDNAICRSIADIDLDIFGFNFTGLDTLFGEVSSDLGDFLDKVEQSSELKQPVINLRRGSTVVPEKNTILKLDRETFEDDWEEGSLDKLEVFFSRCFVRPMDILRNQLEQIRYIGPIRKIPSRNYVFSLTEETAWSNGIAAWDALYHEEAKDLNNLVGKVNEYMTDLLDLGYKLDRTDVVEVDAYEDGEFARTLKELAYSHEYSDDDYYEDDDKPGLKLLKLFEGLAKVRKLYLEDLNNGIKVAPNDVGVGVSQIVPVIVGALAETKQGKMPSILSVEQPELHIHPAVQCALGDLFIREKADNRIFILETHSEHLILRLLRRISETTDNEIKDQALELSPEDLGIYYIHNENDELVLKELPVDKDGEFVENWPDGFFDERVVELFGEDDEDV
jgi:energy-coupling factor transporter ATP-binding protein EcfA2